MSAPAFTPGPWRATRADHPTDWCIHANQHWQLAYLRDDERANWPLEANARLIAAAPELYEAARLFVEEYDASDDSDGVGMMLAYNAALNAARSALRKARGEQ